MTVYGGKSRAALSEHNVLLLGAVAKINANTKLAIVFWGQLQ
jgi:hypothetical protein